ncbi:hypothetical protein [Streptomyces sp. C11-1]
MAAFTSLKTVRSTPSARNSLWQFPVEGFGVVEQGLEMRLKLLQGAEDPSVGRVGLSQKLVELVQTIGDCFQNCLL